MLKSKLNLIGQLLQNFSKKKQLIKNKKLTNTNKLQGKALYENNQLTISKTLENRTSTKKWLFKMFNCFFQTVVVTQFKK